MKKFSKKLQHEESKIDKKNCGIIKSPYDVYLEMEKNGELERFREECEIKGMSAKDAECILCFLKSLSKFLKNSREIKAFFEWIKFDTESEKVFFSTVHSSKGLEYDCVIVIDATEDEFPKRTAVSLNEIEEERRLFYVAMTRAKKKLYVVSPDKCGRMACLPGLFFRETAEVLRA